MPIENVSSTDQTEVAQNNLSNLGNEKGEDQRSSAAPDEEAKNLEASDASNATEGSEDSVTDEGERKRKSGFQRKVDKLTRKAADARREAEFWRAEALKTRDQKSEEKPLKQESAPNGRPKPDDFDSHDGYVEALVEWKADQKLKAKDQSEKEARLKAEQEKQFSAHVERVETFKKNHPDFDELMEEVDDIPMSLGMQQALLDSENGPELMYELAKNRKEYERINSLPAFSLARELGRFEAKLAKESSANNEVKTTKAPAPIKPVGGMAASGTRKNIYDPDTSFADYVRLRREQLKRRA
jgi:hypothetical protein